MPTTERAPTIFINYRRKVSQKDANSITASLQAHFGKDAVFQDTQLEPGENWEREIDAELRGAEVFLALIGKEWLECAYDETNAARNWKKGRCRLDNRSDYVRVEIEQALKMGKGIIPVLIDREGYDSEEDFPEKSTLVQLLKINPFCLRSVHFEADMRQLIAAIEQLGVKAAQPSKRADPDAFRLKKEYPLPPKMLLKVDAPFVGLRPFTERDALIFHGRSAEIYNLCFAVDQQPDQPIVLYYGLSGVGKSSLLQAGAIPRLEHKGWNAPYGRREEDKERRGLVGVAERLQQHCSLLGTKAVLIIDQVEEALIDPIDDFPEEWDEFFDWVRQVPRRKPDWRIVLGFRSEYLPQVREALKGVAYNDQLFLQALTEAGLYEAILGVSKNNKLGRFADFSFEEGLPELLVSDIRQDKASNQAPLLQTQLKALWQQAIQGKPLGHIPITKRHYEDLGYRSLEQMLDHQLAAVGRQFPDEVAGGLVLDVLFLFTTRDNTAAYYSDAEMEQIYPQSSLLSIIQALERHYLLLRFRDWANNPQTRLAHDALAPIVRNRYEQSDDLAQRAWVLIQAKKKDLKAESGTSFSNTDVDLISRARPYLRRIPDLIEEQLRVDEARIARQQADARAKNQVIFDTLARNALDAIRQADHLLALPAFEAAVLADMDLPTKQTQLGRGLQELLFFFAETGRHVEQGTQVLQLLHKLETSKSDRMAIETVLAQAPQEREPYRQLLRQLDAEFFQALWKRYYPEMMDVEGGTFKMGSEDGYADEQPVHKVRVVDFRIARTPTTNYQFGLFCAATGRNLAAHTPFWGRYGNNPVVQVMWYDAVEYANWLSSQLGFSSAYRVDKTTKDPNNQANDVIKWTVEPLDKAAGFRLPTEAEWEYAARGGKKSNDTPYAGSDTLEAVGWFWQNSGDQLLSGEWDQEAIRRSNCRGRTVGELQPNELGLYDMSGNVWEWCWDWYGEDFYEVCKKEQSLLKPYTPNPTGPQSGSRRVLRGGSWYYPAANCRVAMRSNLNPGYGNNAMGFRLLQGFTL